MVTLALLNVLYHLGVNHQIAGADRLAIYLLIHTILLLVAIIAARIIPVFTGNWLRQQGHKQMPVVKASELLELNFPVALFVQRRRILTLKQRIYSCKPSKTMWLSPCEALCVKRGGDQA